MRMLRTPSPNAHLSKLERCGQKELLSIFEYCLKTGSKKTPYGPLAAVWSRLFSELYFSAEELVDEIEHGEGRLGDAHARMLREVIRSDCASGGSFVLEVIRTGGKIDRAALIMIADLDDLTGSEIQGQLPLLMLIDACDKRVRPALIRRAGQRLRFYDTRGIPLIFSILGLCDLDLEDLDAIASVFSDSDLKNIMSRSRIGKTAFDEFTNVSSQIRRYNARERNAVVERNAFYIPSAQDAPEKEMERPVRVRTLPRKNGS